MATIVNKHQGKFCLQLFIIRNCLLASRKDISKDSMRHAEQSTNGMLDVEPSQNEEPNDDVDNDDEEQQSL